MVAVVQRVCVGSGPSAACARSSAPEPACEPSCPVEVSPAWPEVGEQQPQDRQIEEITKGLGGQVVLVDPVGGVEQPDHPPHQLGVAGQRPGQEQQRGEVKQVEGDRGPRAEAERGRHPGKLDQRRQPHEEAGPAEVSVDPRVDDPGPDEVLGDTRMPEHDGSAWLVRDDCREPVQHDHQQQDMHQEQPGQLIGAPPAGDEAEGEQPECQPRRPRQHRDQAEIIHGARVDACQRPGPDRDRGGRQHQEACLFQDRSRGAPSAPPPPVPTGLWGVRLPPGCPEPDSGPAGNDRLDGDPRDRHAGEAVFHTR